MFTHDPGSVPTLLHPPKQIQYRPCWRGRFWCIGRGEGEGIRMLGVLQRDYTDTAAGDNLLKECDFHWLPHSFLILILWWFQAEQTTLHDLTTDHTHVLRRYAFRVPLVPQHLLPTARLMAQTLVHHPSPFVYEPSHSTATTSLFSWGGKQCGITGLVRRESVRQGMGA
jgi:hypothetical protein